MLGLGFAIIGHEGILLILVLLGMTWTLGIGILGVVARIPFVLEALSPGVGGSRMDWTWCVIVDSSGTTLGLAVVIFTYWFPFLVAVAWLGLTCFV